MSKVQVLTLWIIAALLAGAVIAVKATQNKGADAVTAITPGQKLLPKFPARDVAALTIKGVDQSVTVRRNGDAWVVNERSDYPANTAMLGDFLNTLVELKAAQGLEAGATYNERFGMDAKASEEAGHGLHLTFKGADGKELATLALGKASDSGGGDPFSMMGGGRSGRYVRVHTDPDSVYVVEETFPRITANPKDWLSEDFLQVKNIKRMTLRATDDDSFEPWSLVRSNTNGDFTMETLADGEEMNPNATNPLKNIFSFARFEDVVPEDEAAKLRDLNQDRQVVITTFDGFTYTIDMAPKRAVTPAAGEPTPPTTGNENFLLSVKISATFPEKRAPATDETPEDAKKKDEAFTQQQQELKKQLAAQKKLEGRVYEVTNWTVNSLIKNRSELVQAKTSPEPGAGTPQVPAPIPSPNPNPPFLQP